MPPWVVGELLVEHVPELASDELELVAIARAICEPRKVAVRQRLRVQPSTARPALLVLGRAGERIRPVRDALGQERVDIVQWHAQPPRYIADALGLTYLASAVLYPVRRRADVLLGEIDFAAARGARTRNMLLASALISGPVRVKQIARTRTRTWHTLESAMTEQRAVRTEVFGKAPKGVRVCIYGLNALLPFRRVSGVKRTTPPHLVEAKVQGLFHGTPLDASLALVRSTETRPIVEHSIPISSLGATGGRT